MNALLLTALLAVQPAVQDDPYLYRVTLVRAAPGHLLDLLEAYEERMAFYDEASEPRPAIIRHSQGDHWDLMVIHPVQSLPSYYSAARVGRRVAAGEAVGMTPHAFEDHIAPFISWREDTFFNGIAEPEFRRKYDAAGYFHIEMFEGLPGKRDELLRQREMENDYYHRTGREGNLIFDRVLGGAWDSMTLGFYRNLQHFAEGSGLTAEEEEAAAVAAGFEARNRIGTYLRSLLARHNDTLGTKAIQ